MVVAGDGNRISFHHQPTVWRYTERRSVCDTVGVELPSARPWREGPNKNLGGLVTLTVEGHTEIFCLMFS